MWEEEEVRPTAATLFGSSRENESLREELENYMAMAQRGELTPETAQRITSTPRHRSRTGGPQLLAEEALKKAPNTGAGDDAGRGPTRFGFGAGRCRRREALGSATVFFEPRGDNDAQHNFTTELHTRLMRNKSSKKETHNTSTQNQEETMPKPRRRFSLSKRSAVGKWRDATSHPRHRQHPCGVGGDFGNAARKATGEVDSLG